MMLCGDRWVSGGDDNGTNTRSMKLFELMLELLLREKKERGGRQQLRLLLL